MSRNVQSARNRPPAQACSAAPVAIDRGRGQAWFAAPNSIFLYLASPMPTNAPLTERSPAAISAAPSSPANRPLFILAYGYIDRGLAFSGPYLTGVEDADILIDAPYDWWLLPVLQPENEAGSHIVLRGTIDTGISIEGPYTTARDAEERLSRLDLPGRVVVLEPPLTADVPN